MAESQSEDPTEEGDMTKAFNAAQQGDRTSMISLLQAWLARPARRTARKLDSNVNDTDVISQEALMRVYARSKSTNWKSKAHFTNWVKCIVRNIGIDIYRQEHGRQADCRLDGQEFTSVERPIAPAPPRFEAVSDSERLIAKVPEFSLIDRLALDQALSLLKHQAPRSYGVIACRYFSEVNVMSIEATAKTMRSGVKQVKALEENAFRILKKHLRNESAEHDTR